MSSLVYPDAPTSTILYISYLHIKSLYILGDPVNKVKHWDMFFQTLSHSSDINSRETISFFTFVHIPKLFHLNIISLKI